MFLIGAGKASKAMAFAMEELIGDSLTSGVIISKTKSATASIKIEELTGGHPVPDQSSLDGTRKLMSQIQNLTQSDLVFCLISGGGSALMAAPANGISLLEMQQLVRILLGCGATIHEINTIRKHIDRVKGGGLAKIIYPAQCVTLLLSDVVGNSIDVIASGPTVPDETSYEDAEQVINKHGIREKIPRSILEVLREGRAGLLPETLKVDDPRYERVQNVIIGSNQQAAEAAVVQAKLEGFDGQLLTTYLQGESRLAGEFLSTIMHQMAVHNQPVRRPACLVVGGETTVVLKNHGKGGRNQELALSSVEVIAGLDRVTLVTLATDGEDGPTDAAGAVVTGETAARAAQTGLSDRSYLDQNNSYEFFEKLGDLIKIGPTGTNVNDLDFLFTF